MFALLCSLRCRSTILLLAIFLLCSTPTAIINAALSQGHRIIELQRRLNVSPKTFPPKDSGFLQKSWLRLVPSRRQSSRPPIDIVYPHPSRATRRADADATDGRRPGCGAPSCHVSAGAPGHTGGSGLGRAWAGSRLTEQPLGV